MCVCAPVSASASFGDLNWVTWVMASHSQGSTSVVVVVRCERRLVNGDGRVRPAEISGLDFVILPVRKAVDRPLQTD
jgi:hypothetical protein